MKRFNTAGTCFPDVHYMVNIDRQVEAAAKLVRQGDYFCINRGRQYGKTTTLAALENYLSKEYCVMKVSFESAGDSAFATAATANAYFLKRLKREAPNADTNVMEYLKSVCPPGLREMEDIDFSEIVEEICTISAKPVVVLIDEVDQAGNNQGFIKFLGELRTMYLDRAAHPTFQSVILAGVYDVKNLKLKIRSDEEHQYNSPWNIAAPFNVDMSLPADGIASMLDDYAKEHGIQFDTTYIGQLIYDYTSGYPFLVSRMCQIIDEEDYGWDKEGVLKAVNVILKEENTLFDDLMKKLRQFPELKELMRQILYLGKKKTFSTDEHYLQLARRFNFVEENDGYVKIACRLMETRLYNLFIAEADSEKIFTEGRYDHNQFIHDGHIDMRHLLERFCVHFNDIFRTEDGTMDFEFIEKQGRKQFLLYLRPIINGKGNYYVEAETRDETRTDVVIDYLGQQYVIELKIWRGEAYNERGEQQLAEYLDYFHLQTGYMLSFCFNKNKQPGIHEVMVGERTIIEAVV